MADNELRVDPAVLTATSSTSAKLGTDVAGLRVGDSLTAAGSAASGLLSGAATRDLGSSIDQTSKKLGESWAKFSEKTSKAAELYTKSDQEIARKMKQAGDQFDPDDPSSGSGTEAPAPTTPGVTAEQLQKIMSSQGANFTMADAEAFLPSINKAMQDAGITTPDQQAAFLAQIAEESGGLTMMTEKPWGLDQSEWDNPQAVQQYFNNKYANIIGNGDAASGDGYKYRGRGILQITGRDNYAMISQKLYGDDRLVQNPDLLSEPAAASAAAAAYWQENNLNRFIPAGAPVTAGQFQDLGSTINTGQPGNVPYGAAERVKYWEAAKAALGVS
ncbi:glycoside hydrolase family 19 protein [Mycolicibacterium fortuitum]|jgi:putative chitinase|uniref:Glycoside hydrolase family 19 protein n=2 Tax=Mycolicibacterium fortuitum TaxID=1766 RepID=A0AAE4VD16_MYCFO|nr:glycoside hydrolase family 19 protein [Mycolicibacterium fortuitum]MDO3239372.1 glycoside hydrolase family 19 protein [Mycobacteroides abscessus subsp. abscessus]MBP3085818.1 hypothetical protein [Mycolicibacterium fortuitum]MCA4755309.1 hypothetical protein [Mycolicibacterium fortuitum]MCV7143113.1 hypothetical protein [Mycolicibacterium fortuitum]MDG5770878.1 glycoside hydrolase family 19 protein [Mycolicibacterium fortuitum]